VAGVDLEHELDDELLDSSGMMTQLADLSPSMSIRIFSIFSISILIFSILLSQLHAGVGGMTK